MCYTPNHFSLWSVVDHGSLCLENTVRQLCRQAEEYLVQNVIIHIVQMPEPKLILNEITEFAGLRE